MARVTVEDCIDKVDNRFELVLLASHRARMISSGAPITIDRDNDKNPVVALREIADETLVARRSQGRPDPFAAEICRGRRARGRGQDDDRPGCSDAEADEREDETSPSTACRRKSCCAASKAWFRRRRATITERTRALAIASAAP